MEMELLRKLALCVPLIECIVLSLWFIRWVMRATDTPQPQLKRLAGGVEPLNKALANSGWIWDGKKFKHYKKDLDIAWAKFCEGDKC